MKKLVYIFALVTSLALTVASCTEEVVKPKDGVDTSGGTGSSSTKGS